MDHSKMDHSSHSMDMDMPMHDMCSMNMLFTWDWKNSCIVFKWWHVKTASGFVGSVLALVVLSLLYEYFRYHVNRWKANYWARSPIQTGPQTARSFRMKLAFLYAVQVGYSFMLMLVFMTYNGWYMLATVAGAGLGYFLWGDEAERQSMVCH